MLVNISKAIDGLTHVVQELVKEYPEKKTSSIGVDEDEVLRKQGVTVAIGEMPVGQYEDWMSSKQNPKKDNGLEEVVKKFNDEWRQIRDDLETIGNLSRNHWKETQIGDVSVSGNSARVNRININRISLEAKDNSLAERFDGWMKSYSTSINETASQDNSSISWPPANVFVEADNLSTHGMNQTLFDQLLGATDDFTSTDTNHLQIHNPEDSNTNSFNVQKWAEIFKTNGKPTTTIDSFDSSGSSWATWSDWSSWGQCSVTCGRGEKVRRRRCEMVIEGFPIPADSCIGSSEEVAACEVKACHDGSDWSSWGQCSVTCGRGREGSRRRCEMVIEGFPIPADSCIGSSEEVAACDVKACLDADKSRKLTTPSWTDWSKINEGSTTTIDSFGSSGSSWATWSDWSSWGQCSVTCGRGEKVRRRRCEMVIEGFPIPADSCIGSSEEVAACEVKACHDADKSRKLATPSWTEWSTIHAKPTTTIHLFGSSVNLSVRWSDWSSWGQCSVTCGRGEKVRRRRCEMVIEGLPIPADSCIGSSEEVAACEVKACHDGLTGHLGVNALSLVEEERRFGEGDVKWSLKVCLYQRILASVLQKKLRHVKKKHVTVTTSLVSSSLQVGLIGPIPRKDIHIGQFIRFIKYFLGRWSDWSSWGQCSVTCGRGKKVRKRRCEMVIEGFPIPADSCIGSSEEVAACEVKACLGDDESTQLISPSWADWSNTQEKTSTTANSFGLSKTSRVRWSDWSSWGQCSVTCGSGRKVRGRRCEMVIEGFLIPADSCFGPPEEVAACEMKACLGKIEVPRVLILL
ncbi:angiogenesis inhibito [Apostichopus japonicus]|uniref:Angiogenesis inhibito n=1 Tax=Stichopus japonicus TaxID=307972 RepID=A0A2G8LDL9_STIJA|nr:angiogenesis inhibito [Apostichopus japonicus]